jgi:hypothetical protein
VFASLDEDLVRYLESGRRGDLGLVGRGRGRGRGGEMGGFGRR